MKKVEKWEASDGAEFDSELECGAHEAAIIDGEEVGEWIAHCTEQLLQRGCGDGLTRGERMALSAKRNAVMAFIAWQRGRAHAAPEVGK